MKPMSFTQAVEFFRDKTTLTPEKFRALVAELGARAHSVAFTAARVTKADVLMDLQDAVLRAIEDGETFWDFRQRIDEIAKQRGWTGASPYRLDNIFRTNIQTAYNVGRYKQMTAIAERRPYWEYDAVNDSRTRPSHLAHDGKIYHHLHPFWNTWYPPNGYRCRCKVNSLSREEMGEEGLEEEIRGTDLKPDKGFAFNPAKESWSPDLAKYPEVLRKALKEDIG